MTGALDQQTRRGRTAILGQKTDGTELSFDIASILFQNVRGERCGEIFLTETQQIQVVNGCAGNRLLVER